MWSTPGLDQSSVRLQVYSGEPITVVSSTQVVVEHNGQTLTLLIVTRGSRPFLLGRHWLMTLWLDWHRIFKLESQVTLQEVSECTMMFSNLDLKNWRGWEQSYMLTKPFNHDSWSHGQYPLPFERRWMRSWTAYRHWVWSSQCSSQSGLRLLFWYWKVMTKWGSVVTVK